MGLFGRSRKMNNAAAGALPQTRPIVTPGQTTIHNHAPNEALNNLGKVAAGFLTVAGVWGALWFIFWQMGSYRPGEDAASLVLYGTLIPVGLWFLSWLLGPYFESRQSFKLEIEREITRREEIRLLGAQTALEPGRYNEDDYQFARVVLAVMMQAYDWREKSGGVDFRGQWRPWSMRSALETANGIGVKLSRDRANEISVWLHKKGVITSPDGGQIVTQTFPNLSNVRVMLDREFGKPIQVIAPALRDNRGFEHI